jgi:anaerobic C4-dicarboxylate transporter DcuB
VVFSIAQAFKVNLLPSYSTIVATKAGKSATFVAQSIDTVAIKTITVNGEEVHKQDTITVATADAKPIKVKTDDLIKGKIVIDNVTKKTDKPLAMNLVIQIVMISAAALMIIFCKAKPKKAVGGAVWQSGMVAVVAIYGIAWLADTYFSNYMPEMKAMLGDMVKEYPWTIAIAFFLVSVLINSQGAVVVAMLPLAYSLGIHGWVLLGVLPSVYGYFFIPNYPSDIATVNFDRTGTTVIGKYLLNHSFMMPGLVCVTCSTLVAYALSMLFH